jgi:hypothetical protein
VAAQNHTSTVRLAEFSGRMRLLVQQDQPVNQNQSCRGGGEGNVRFPAGEHPATPVTVGEHGEGAGRGQLRGPGRQPSRVGGPRVHAGDDQFEAGRERIRTLCAVITLCAPRAARCGVGSGVAA